LKTGNPIAEDEEDIASGGLKAFLKEYST